MHTETQLLVIGAGPFGLALAACAKDAGIECAVAGRPMSFWTEHMPRGMFLRSGPDWHLDTADVHTIAAFLAERGIAASEVAPLPRDRYLEYVEWFRRAKGIEPMPLPIVRLDHAASGTGFVASCENGDTIGASSVALALGFQYFHHAPAPLAAMIPASRLAHTCDCVDPFAMRGQRCLIVGGRQSAFEWAALLVEAGARAVHLTYRHETPRFTESDWAWVPPLVARIAAEPGWYRALSEQERDGYNRRLYEEGRLKLEPWLAPRIASPVVTLWPRTEIAGAVEHVDGLAVTLSSGDSVDVDQVVLATGYKVDIARVPFLARGTLLASVEVRNGFPVLDERLQTSVPGLFATSMMAMQDFGSFFGFTVSARASARLITDAVVGGALTG